MPQPEPLSDLRESAGGSIHHMRPQSTIEMTVTNGARDREQLPGAPFLAQPDSGGIGVMRRDRPFLVKALSEVDVGIEAVVHPRTIELIRTIGKAQDPRVNANRLNVVPEFGV